MKKLISLSVLVIGLLIASCGKDVCVAGIGKCARPDNIETQSGNKDDDPISIDSEFDKLAEGEETKITAKGGYGALSFSIQSGATSADMREGTAAGPNSNFKKQVIFKAPKAFKRAIIRVTDTRNDYEEIVILKK